MELVRKPTGIYWARGTDPNKDRISEVKVEESRGCLEASGEQ